MPDPGYGDSIMVHFSLPPLFMGAEADTDESIHPEVPDMVHLNPPQLHMHAAEEGAVQRVQPQETSKPAQPHLMSIIFGMLPLILLVIGLVMHAHPNTPAYQEHEALRNIVETNMSEYSLPNFPPACHDDIMEKDRAASWVGQTEVNQDNPCTGHVGAYCSSADGKYPGIHTVFTTPAMELEGSTAPAIDKMMEFFAIMIRVDHCLPVRNVVPVLSDGLRHSPLSEMAEGAALKKMFTKR